LSRRTPKPAVGNTRRIGSIASEPTFAAPVWTVEIASIPDLSSPSMGARRSDSRRRSSVHTSAVSKSNASGKKRLVSKLLFLGPLSSIARTRCATSGPSRQRGRERQSLLGRTLSRPWKAMRMLYNTGNQTCLLPAME
jgi:hypothetical protein